MKLKDIIKCVTSGVPSLKSVEQRIEEQNTRTVWFPRVWGFPRKYVYGKRPGEPLKHPEWHPDGPQYPKCASESSPELIERHIAICLRAFVSLAANAGVPLHIVQSIVGHESTAMTRHYYHENLTALKSAVAAIPTL